MNMAPLFWQLPTCFNFSDKFLKDYLPTTIELGRSFVTLEYQSTRADSKGLFALDNLWDGLGALTVVMPNVKYFLRKGDYVSQLSSSEP